MYIYKICIGDSSGDGHGMKEWLLFECSLDKHKLLEAYDKLTEQLGFDFVKTVCHDFENHYISKDQLEAINRVLGKNLFEDAYDNWEDYVDEDYYVETPEELLSILLELLDKVEPLKFDIIDDNTEVISFGSSFGYGLFSY